MPRITRDVAAISVSIDPYGAQPPDRKVIGGGTPEEGGGLLHGGLRLMNRFTASIRDPAVPSGIVVTVAAIDGRLVAESMTIAERPGGPPLTSAAVRQTGLSLYVQRIREELGNHTDDGLLRKETSRDDERVTCDLPVMSGDWGFAEMRRAVRGVKITPEMVAEAYLDALGAPGPEQNRRPTAAAAEKLGVSRGYASLRLTEARKRGIPGLGPGRRR